MAKVINTVKKYEREFYPPGPTCGVRGDLVQFNERDIDALCGMTPENLHEYFTQCIKPRMFSRDQLEMFSGGYGNC